MFWPAWTALVVWTLVSAYYGGRLCMARNVTFVAWCISAVVVCSVAIAAAAHDMGGM